MAKMETIHVDVRPHIAASARPGDTVVVGFNRTLTDEELDELYAQFNGFTETTGIHVAIVEDVSSMVVLRGPEDEEYRDAGAG